MNIKHDMKDFKIEELDLKKGFKFKSKNKEIEFEIYDSDLIKRVIDKKFHYQYKKILVTSTIILESDDEETSGDIKIQLEIIDSYIRTILNKYKNYIDEKTLNKYLRMLNIQKEDLENKLNSLLITNKKGSRWEVR